MLHFILLLILTNVFSTNEESEKRLTLKFQRKKSFAAAVFTSTTNLAPTEKKPCQWIKRLKHQHKICERRRGLPEALLRAKYWSVFFCESLFEFVQWNCSNREFFFKNMYRETAFMHSLASSALMFSIARACSEGTLQGCSCGESDKTNISKGPVNYCSDNMKFAKKFTKKFLQLRKKGDEFNAIVKYNTEVGIKVVLETFEKEKPICRCHGISGDCSWKVCWKQIQSFDSVARQLKILYHHAIPVQLGNNRRDFKSGKNAQKLLYLENSPNFCLKTAGRRCNSTESCATVCCGRYHHHKQITVVNNRCKCRWRPEKYDVKCRTCFENRTLFLCP